MLCMDIDSITSTIDESFTFINKLKFNQIVFLNMIVSLYKNLVVEKFLNINII